MEIPHEALKRAQSAFLSFLRLDPLTVTFSRFADVLSLGHRAVKGHPPFSWAISTKYPHWLHRHKKSPQNHVWGLLKATGVLPGGSGQHRAPETTVWWHHSGQRLWEWTWQGTRRYFFFYILSFFFLFTMYLKSHKSNKLNQQQHIVAASFDPASFDRKCPSQTAQSEDLKTRQQPRAARVPRPGAASSPVNGQDLSQPLRLKVGFSNRTDTRCNIPAKLLDASNYCQYTKFEREINKEENWVLTCQVDFYLFAVCYF